jgi:hypothetical protein
VLFCVWFSIRILRLLSVTVGDTLAVEGIQGDTRVGEATQGDTMVMEEGTQGDTMVMEGTQADTMVMEDTQGIITIILTVIGGVRVGGGLILMGIHIPMTIPIPIPIPIICLRRRSPKSLPHIASSSSNNLTTGITARIRRDTTHMSKAVREAGYRWNQPRPTRKGGHGKMYQKWSFLLVFFVVALSACATVPSGPSVRVLPGPWKPFEVFQSEEAICRQWAAQQTGTSPNEAVNQNLATGAVLGTLVGAGLGAAIGSTSGDAGIGAAIGAVSGLLFGTAVATGPAYGAGYAAQTRYDNAYVQCMYAKGNQIPGVARPPRRPFYPPPPPPPYGR